MELITDIRILLQKAHTLTVAKQAGNISDIKSAQCLFDEYEALCLQSDKMSLGTTQGALSDIMRGI